MNRSNLSIVLDALKLEALKHINQSINQSLVTNYTEAISYQWAHAIAYNTSFYCNRSFCDEKELKLKVQKILEETGYRPEGLKELLRSNTHINPNVKPKFTFIDLFAGIGGIRLGAQNNGGLCVFSSDFDKYARETYLINYGDLPFGDITQIPPGDMPDHDLLLAGFPCQPFSNAGKKKGIDDTRGTLFRNIVEIMVAKRPKFVLLENVKGLVSHDKGNTIKVILNALTDIGYRCNISKNVIESGRLEDIQREAKKMIFSSTQFGIPQNRKRIYIVLWRDDLALDYFYYPTPKEKVYCVGDILDKEPDESLTITDKLWEGHQRRKKQNEERGKGFGYSLVNAKSQYTATLSARYWKDGAEILIEQDGKNPRKISLREAARLQGFPENFIPNQSSKHQAYKQFGNSVTVNVIEAITRQIYIELERL